MTLLCVFQIYILIWDSLEALHKYKLETVKPIQVH